MGTGIEGLIQEISDEEIDRAKLSLEWQRQARRYVKLGFHTELGLSPEDYLASLPKFEPQPESFRGRFDIPVLVETRIALFRQAELARPVCFRKYPALGFSQWWLHTKTYMWSMVVIPLKVI